MQQEVEVKNKSSNLDYDVEKFKLEAKVTVEI